MSDRPGATSLVCVGTSHRVAPVPFIERATRGADRLRRAYADAVRRAVPYAVPIHELAVLATCNRVELYAACAADDTVRVIDSLASSISPAGAGPRVYHLQDLEAVRHLSRVAVGLDSMVVGEPQIAGQVWRAFEAVDHANGGAPILGAAARTARLASRRVRTETAISRKPASISTVAVHLAAERLGGLEGVRVLVVGAGKIGRLASQALRSSGARITIVNRTLARAESLAARVGARAAPLGGLVGHIADADVIIASTSSPEPVINAAMIRSARSMGGERACLVVDIAMPRDVAEDVAREPGMTVLCIDDLRERVRAHLEERREELPLAESIIEEILSDFARDHESLLPVIGELRRRAERVRHRAVERALRGMDEVDAETRDRIEHLSRALVNRLLHEPTARLRTASDRGRGEEYARVVRDLFGLDGGTDHSP